MAAGSTSFAGSSNERWFGSISSDAFERGATDEAISLKYA